MREALGAELGKYRLLSVATFAHGYGVQMAKTYLEHNTLPSSTQLNE